MQVQYSVSQSHQLTSVISSRVCGSVIGVSGGSCSVVNMLTVLVQDLLLLAQTYTHWDVIHITSHTDTGDAAAVYRIYHSHITPSVQPVSNKSL